MMNEDEVAQLLRAATDDIAVPVVPAQALVAAGDKRRWHRGVVASVAIATTVAAVSVGVPVAVSLHSSAPGVGSPVATMASPDAACVAPVSNRVLPRWARAGFSEARPRMPYVLGDNGEIAAILFAQPLTAPPPAEHNNKILWVSRVEGSSPLRITATLVDGSATATRVIAGGPGPSIIDLPKPGCWHLTLRWGAATDALDLAYLAP